MPLRTRAAASTSAHTTRQTAKEHTACRSVVRSPSSLTALALVLLLNFQSPSGIDVARGTSGTGGTGRIGISGGAASGTGTGGTAQVTGARTIDGADREHAVWLGPGVGHGRRLPDHRRHRAPAPGRRPPLQLDLEPGGARAPQPGARRRRAPPSTACRARPTRARHTRSPSRPRSTAPGCVTAVRAGPAARCPGRQVRVEPVMGTTVSIDIRPPFVDPAAVEAADRLVPRRRPPVLAVPSGQRGDVAWAPASSPSRTPSPDVRAMFTLADELRDRTGGYFDARAHRADGRPDPTGVVKGWSVDEAVAGLRLAGARNLQVVAGGDLVAARRARAGSAVADGHPPSGRWGVNRGRDSASATWRSRRPASTSGAATSSTHIPGACPSGLRSLTVVGPALALADAFATAGFAMGEAGIGWVGRQPGFGALGITAGRPPGDDAPRPCAA